MPETVMSTETTAAALLPAATRRFLVALSFPGEHRSKVKEIAASLAERLGSQEKVFYDEYFKEELARENLAFYLQDIYQEKAELLVIFLCSAYEKKKWCGLEWRAIMNLMADKAERPARMYLRLDSGKVPGFFYNIDGYLDVEGKTSEELAESIVKRLNLELKNFYNQNGSPVTSNPLVIQKLVKPELPAKQDTDTAVKGLKALDELLQSPAVQVVVKEYEEVLSTTSKQINNLTQYKVVHDHLHTLQVHCYNPIWQEFRRFPEKPVDWDGLEEYGNTLENVIRALEDATGEPCFTATEQDKLKSTATILQRSRVDLTSATKQADIKLLKTATQRILTVLGIQPDYFSICLTRLARELHLEKLAVSMQALYSKLQGQTLDAEKLQQFAEGTSAFGRLGAELIQLIDNHDRWQEFDATLRLIEGDPEQFEQLALGTWEDLKSMALKLNSGGQESWAAPIKEKTDELDEAIRTQPKDKAFVAFQKYRGWTVQRFYRVDRDLLKLCAKLCRVGVPLDSILGKDR